MPNAVTHPTPQELAAFGLGKLPEAAAEAVAAHLEGCAACQQVVAGLPPDSFLGKVRAAGAGSVSVAAEVTQPEEAPQRAEPAPLSPSPPGVPAELAQHPKFQILRELGRGGMGVVYQARHTVMNRPVVIKVINQALLAQPDALERFRREIQAAASLAHPNIVTAHDAEQAGKLHLLVMEFVPGQSLAEVLQKKGPLPVAQACGLVRQAALGLQHAHERGMVHRDIKPHNLMLTPKGQVKILDFGLAKVASERGQDRGLTASGAYVGTPEYSAPEQAQDARSADIRADLYSLGCTLYCLLAGRPPFQGRTGIMTIMAHLQEEPRPLPELRPDIPAGLWAVVARLLAKEPARRYQTPAEAARALAPFCKTGGRPGVGARIPRMPGTAVPGTDPNRGGNSNLVQEALKGAVGKAPGPAPPKGCETANPFAEGVGALPPPPGQEKVRRGAKLDSRKKWLIRGGIAAGALLTGLLSLWASGVLKGVAPLPDTAAPHIGSGGGQVVEAADVPYTDLADPRPKLAVAFKHGRFGITMLDEPDPADDRGQKRLTFDPEGGTNNTCVRLDGTEPLFGLPPGHWVQGRSLEKARNRQRWTSQWAYPEQVLVTQVVELVPGQTRRLDTVLVHYVLENRSEQSHAVGLRVLLDTFIGANDGVPFRVPGRSTFLETKEDFPAAAMPDYVQAWERPDPKDPGTIAHLGLKGIELPGGSPEPIALLRICHWPKNSEARWEWEPEAINQPEDRDSCVVLYWEERRMAPGDRRDLAFTYGLNAISSTESGNAGLSLTAGGSFRVGGEFTLTATVKAPQAGQTATLELPRGLTLVPGEQAERALDGGGDYAQVSWRVRSTAAGDYRPLVTTGGHKESYKVRITTRSIFD